MVLLWNSNGWLDGATTGEQRSSAEETGQQRKPLDEGWSNERRRSSNTDEAAGRPGVVYMYRALRRGLGEKFCHFVPEWFLGLGWMAKRWRRVLGYQAARPL